MTASPRRGPPLAVIWGVGAYLAAYAGWQVFGWGGPEARQVIGDLAFLPVYGTTAVMAWLASRRCAEAPRLRSAWRLITVGAVFYLLGITLQSYYEIVAGSKPFPSLADPAYLMFYPFALAGLLRFPHAGETRSQRRRTLIDCATVAIAGGAVVWYIVLGPATVTSGTTLQTLVSIAAPVGDLILMVGLATTLLRRTVPSSELALRWLAKGLLFVIAADLAYGWLSLHSRYSGGDPVDGLYILAFCMFLIGAASQRRPRSADERVDARPIKRASLLPLLGVAIVFVLLGLAIRHDEFAPAGGLLVSTVAVAVLVAARQLFAQRELLTTHRELELAHGELDALATTDPVTLMPNHRALIASINQEVARSQRLESSFAVVFLDVDHFKTLNDTFGHAAGDTALRELAAVGRSCLRGVDTIGRWGGEEFLVLLPHTGRAEAMVSTERLRRAIAAHRFAGTAEARLTCSLGVAIYPDDGRTRTELVDSADRAMYAAKRFGRNQVFAAADPAAAALHRHPHASDSGDQNALAGAVDALALLVDERDSYTDGHAAGVSALSCRLATELRCDPADTSTIGMAARLHDIGKVAVPDAILLKPDPLTDEEWALMHKHPVVAAEVLSRIPALRPLAHLVRAHHERWDGTGYPDGVAGEDIPLGARIIAVADAFNAMTNMRPYSRASDPHLALAELRRFSGTQFDPRVVAAMDQALHPGETLAATPTPN